MSKLNEEIIDCLQYWTRAVPSAVVHCEAGKSCSICAQDRKDIEMYNRTQRLLDFFVARRHIEECRRDEE